MWESCRTRTVITIWMERDCTVEMVPGCTGSYIYNGTECVWYGDYYRTGDRRPSGYPSTKGATSVPKTTCGEWKPKISEHTDKPQCRHMTVFSKLTDWRLER